MRLGILGALVIAGLVVGGCNSVTDPSQNVTDTLSNTVQVGSYNFNSFNVGHAGEFSITLVSLTPPASVFVSVSFGIPTGAACSPSQQPNTFSTPGHTVLSGQITSPGTYCVRVDDEGFFTVPETYTVQVSHP